MTNRPLLLILALAAAACAPKRVHEEPILENGERVRPVEAEEVAAVAAARQAQADAVAQRDQAAADALAACAPEVCAALARGELALGMTSPQVLAATRTTEDAWSVRSSGGATVFVPRTLASAPRDGVSKVAMVQLRDGRVSAYSYQEAQGLRVVSRPEDATTEGRAAALAQMLVREADEMAAAGDLAAALDRYDRAEVLTPADPEIDFKIAAVLDKQLRPVEALIRYQLFLHRMDLEKIEARGQAAAHLAEAIALAQQRVIILERQGR